MAEFELDRRKLYAVPHDSAHDAIDEGDDDEQVTYDHRERSLFRTSSMMHVSDIRRVVISARGVLALMCPIKRDPDVSSLKRNIACMTVTTLMTMLTENVERMSILLSRLSFTPCKNMIGSTVKSMSAQQSAVKKKEINHDGR